MSDDGLTARERSAWRRVFRLTLVALETRAASSAEEASRAASRAWRVPIPAPRDKDRMRAHRDFLEAVIALPTQSPLARLIRAPELRAQVGALGAALGAHPEPDQADAPQRRRRADIDD